ncbi:4Fe-4S binding protein [Ornithinimicrobium flavum]|uniref:4Fe-4S binding protein n=1 Tax=Ornithinimicrobium flavum TaxID=1288636 RepID=UPI00106F1BE5
MRPIGRAAASGGVPQIPYSPATNLRKHFAPLQMLDGSTAQCWRCADAPCTWFTPQEVARHIPAPLSLNPDRLVCPTDALSIKVGEAPVIDPDRCIGCGLCVTRCPVGAIHLDPATSEAQVGAAAEGSMVPFREFESRRRRAAALLSYEPALHRRQLGGASTA